MKTSDEPNEHQDGNTWLPNEEAPEVEVVNTRLGLKVPALVTPDLLRPWEDRV